MNLVRTFTIDLRGTEVEIEAAIDKATAEILRVTDTAGQHVDVTPDDLDAITRARILYFMQIGYNDAELHEPMAERLKLLPFYLSAFTGREPRPREVTEFVNYTYSIRGEADHE